MENSSRKKSLLMIWWHAKLSRQQSESKIGIQAGVEEAPTCCFRLARLLPTADVAWTDIVEATEQV